jgi:predicted transposase YbfD/YdcC
VFELGQLFESVPDPRRAGYRQKYRLCDLLMLCLCAVLSGANSFTEIAWYGRLYRELLVERLGLQFEASTPSHDTLGRLFSLLDGAALICCFETWMAHLHEATQGEVMALDGKTVCGSFDSANGSKALHLVSAFACEARLVLGLEEASSVGQEVEAMHALLSRLELKGRTVTMDAAGTEPKMAAVIVSRQGHYVLALKANHRHLHEDVAAFFVWLDNVERRSGATHAAADSGVVAAAVGLEWHETPHSQETQHSEGGHGRVESRRVRAVSVECLREFVTPSLAQWPHLQSVVMVERVRKNRVRGQDRRTVTRAYYLSSLPARHSADVQRLGQTIRAHWSIENGQHWVLDVVWDEDASRVRKAQAPKNLALLRRLATNIMRQDTTYNISLSLKRKTAAWNTDFLLQKLVGSNPPLTNA